MCMIVTCPTYPSRGHWLIPIQGTATTNYKWDLISAVVRVVRTRFSLCLCMFVQSCSECSMCQRHRREQASPSTVPASVSLRSQHHTWRVCYTGSVYPILTADWAIGTTNLGLLLRHQHSLYLHNVQISDVNASLGAVLICRNIKSSVTNSQQFVLC